MLTEWNGRRWLAGVVAGVLLAGLAARAEESLDTLCDRLAKHEFGQNREAITAIETRMRDASAAERQAIARKLADVVADEKATVAGKHYACRILKRIGGADAVGALAGLLGDEQLSHMALYALGTMSGEAADRALREALPRVPPGLRAGIVDVIGARGDAGALRALSPLLAADEAQVQEAAVAAVGRIGTGEAGALLLQLPASVAERMVWADASLVCAERLSEAGDRAAAMRLCERLLQAGRAAHVRVAALRILATVDAAKAVPLVLACLRGDEAVLRRAAADAVSAIPGSAAATTLAAELRNLPPEAQIALLRGLGARGDRAASPAVLTLAQTAKGDVKGAALAALGSIGDAAAVPILLKAAAGEAEGAGAAARNLARLSAPGVDNALIDAVAGVDSGVRASAASALAARGATQAVPQLLACLAGADAALRRALGKAVQTLAGPGDLPSLVALMAKTDEEEERATLERSVGSVIAKVEDPAQAAAQLLAAWDGAAPPARAALLRLLGRTGGKEALGKVREAAASEDELLRDAAIRTLAEWPSAAAIPDLEGIANTAKSPVHRVLALRGYIRLLGQAAAKPDTVSVKRFERALELATRPDEKKLVIGRLATVKHPESLRLVVGCLGDPAVKTEATDACIRLLKGLSRTDAKAASATLKRLTDGSYGQPLAARAAALLKDAASNVYQAETAELDGAAVTSDHGGFTGAGYVDFKVSAGASITWRVSVEEGGPRQVIFVYALGDDPRPLDISVDGTRIKEKAAFPSTGAWDKWGSAELTVNLTAGTHRLTAATTGSEGPNIDCVKVVSGAAPSAKQ